MGRINDIRPLKKELRQKYRLIRANMSQAEKKDCDEKIYNRVISSEVYKNAKSILCFVSSDIEVDTKKLINHALSEGKTVAVPFCLDLKGTMDFYVINSLKELKAQSYGILEPDIKTAKKFKADKDSLCILPGFAFDRDGFRIGFGKGYYDRFLKSFKGKKVGICYNNCIANNLPHGKYDLPADFIITQKYTITIKKEDRS